MRAGRVDWLLYTTAAAFAVAFGYLEAAVAIYADAIAPAASGAGPWQDRAPGWLVATEPVRQIAGLVMLVAFAVFAGRNASQRIGTFLYSLGIRCVIYYVSLFSMVGQPEVPDGPGCLFFLSPGAHPPEGVLLMSGAVLAVVGARLMLAPGQPGGNNERQAIHGARRRR